MRYRSTRLFVVLLHLFGVSTNLPRNLAHWKVGIIGVHPMAILLESLDLEVAGGLDGLLKHMKAAGYSPDDLLAEPFWLQDDVDGKCLGPAGFSECGDATLWLIRKRPPKMRSYNEEEIDDTRSNKHKGFFSFFFRDYSDSVESWAYALQSVDVETISPSTSLSVAGEPENRKRRRGKRRNEIDGECLIPVSRNSAGKRRKQENPKLEWSSLRLGPCSANEAWTWRVSGGGMLVQDREAVSLAESKQRRGWERMISGSKDPSSDDGSGLEASPAQCVWRVNSTSVALAQCERSFAPATGIREEPGVASSKKIGVNERVVGFSLVRYQTAAATKPKIPSLSMITVSPDDIDLPVPVDLSPEAKRPSLRGSEASRSSLSTPTTDSSADNTDTQKRDHLPSTKTTSQTHAASVSLHPDLKPASQLLYTPISHGGEIIKRQEKKAPLALLRDSHPTLMLGESRVTPGIGRPKPTSARGPESRLKKPGAQRSQQLLHHPHVPGSQTDDAPHKPRKIPVHPYIASSKNGVWVDPQTGLEFLTDISGYLGHDRKETGRHTLMGIGQYTRTVFNIKVYGVSFYVAKRDVLADPLFERFAHLSSEELRENDGFYSHLMHMPSPENPNGGLFDRTLLLKLNMQLSTECMRSSLEADWQLLTDEHKDLVIKSSFKARPAEKAMLQKIESEENSSNCSCGQFAPEEYGADPSCCARGTELVFTWRKNGDLEVRLDGRVMDIFPRPDLAEAIFYEYLRGDNPMSMDARDRFSDGFPFLLAPLAQVKGMSSAAMSQASTTVETVENVEGNSVVRMMGNVAGMVHSQASGFSSWVQNGANEMASNAAKAVRSAGDAARNAGDEFDRRRDLLVHHMSSLQSQGANFLSTRLTFARQGRSMVASVSSFFGDNLTGSRFEWDGGKRRRIAQLALHMRSSKHGDSTNPAPLTDEIAPIIYPTMSLTHKLFLALVHCYLMLLLIVSIPGSYGTRTKLIVKRTGGSRDKACDYSGDKSVMLLRPRGKSSPPRGPLHIRLEKISAPESMGRGEEKVGSECQRSHGASITASKGSERKAAFATKGDDKRSSESRDPEQKAVKVPQQQLTQKMKKSLSFFL